MNSDFESAFEALRRASEHMRAAHTAVFAAIEAALSMCDESLDLRNSVERLESALLAQTAEIKALRADIAALKNGR